MKPVEVLTNLGIKSAFRPIVESEPGTILLKTRKPADIVDSRLKGSEIALYGRGTFLVWTPQTKKARRLAKAHGLRVRFLTREAELYVPAKLADEILPMFGAKIRRRLPDAQREACQKRLEGLRLRMKAIKNEVPDTEPPKTGLDTGSHGI